MRKVRGKVEHPFRIIKHLWGGDILNVVTRDFIKIIYSISIILLALDFELPLVVLISYVIILRYAKFI
jgi:hypothetical protein